MPGNARKKITSTAYLQNVDYRYNIRGQLLYINNSTLTNDLGHTNNDSNDLFGMSVMYDQPDANINGVTANYTGRISAVKWMTVNSSLAPTNERSYAYSYDALERYSGSIYAERTGGTGNFNLDTGAFDERNITYDDNGNILTMNRTAAAAVGSSTHTLIDNLAYTYDTSMPNQLDAVNDATANTAGFYYTATSSGYTYDSQGNQLTDPYRGLTINYNLFLDKTDSITKSGSGLITYTYDFKGNLLRKNTYNTSNTLTESLDYIEGMVYSSGTLSYFPMPEGRVINASGTLTPQYVISDQQGNARFSFQNNGSGGITAVQENSYYGYGELLTATTVTMPATPSLNKNLYNGGSEWQQEFGNLPDYHETFYRNYDPETGRFVAGDPMAESAEGMTEFQYAGDDPINGFDPMGDANHTPPLQPAIPGPPPITLNNGTLDAEVQQMDDQTGLYLLSQGGGLEAYDAALAYYDALNSGTNLYNRSNGTGTGGAIQALANAGVSFMVFAYTTNDIQTQQGDPTGADHNLRTQLYMGFVNMDPADISNLQIIQVTNSHDPYDVTGVDKTDQVDGPTNNFPFYYSTSELEDATDVSPSAKYNNTTIYSIMFDDTANRPYSAADPTNTEYFIADFSVVGMINGQYVSLYNGRWGNSTSIDGQVHYIGSPSGPATSPNPVQAISNLIGLLNLVNIIWGTGGGN